MFAQAVVPIVTLAQVHRFIVVVEVDLRIFSKFTVVGKQDARKVIDGPVANGYRRSSSTVNFVEAFFAIGDKRNGVVVFLGHFTCSTLLS